MPRPALPLPSTVKPSPPVLVASALTGAMVFLAVPSPSLAALNDNVLRSLEEYRSSSKPSPSSNPYSAAFPFALPSPSRLAETENAVPYQQYKEEGQRSRPAQSFSALGFEPIDPPRIPGAPPPSPPSTSSSALSSTIASSRAPAAPRPSIKDQLALARQLQEQARKEAAAGNYQEAVRVYSELLERCPDLTVLGQEARFDRALCLYEAGSQVAAQTVLSELRSLKDLNNGDPDLLVVYASVIYAEEPSRIATAELLLEKATKLDPDWNVLAVPKKGSGVARGSAGAGVGPAFEHLRGKGWPPKVTGAVERFLSLK